MRIFITGGTGFIGSYLVSRLLADGHELLVLARSPEAVAAVLDMGAVPVEGELTVPGPWQDEVAGCDRVVHCAAKADDWGRRSDFWRVNVEGTRHMVEAAAGTVDRFVHVSSIAAHRGSGTHDETTPARRGGHPYCDSKAVAEEVVDEAVEKGLNAQLVRVANVYGPRDPHMLPRILEQVSKGRFVVVGDGNQPSNLIYIDDVVDALEAILLQDADPGERFLITDPAAPVISEAIRIAFEALDRDPRITHLPKWVALGVAAFAQAFGLLTGKRPFLTFYAVLAVGNFRTLINDRTMSRLSWSPKVRFREGVGKTVVWWRQTAG
ncbi:MAG: NAD-dependent epimerase/dehydratase family protein [Candidatus Latescibacteria bacterium]|nr:NAD-dependent epimerase/dehydratase family protein [Candidatus Latescibacterota bacterium]